MKRYELTRRNALRLLGGAGAAAAFAPRLFALGGEGVEVLPGPFTNTRESLKSYATPQWFRDAKFGIWAHWGPQSGVEAGDWYAHNMYMQGSRQYQYHCKTYGHPSKVGYKDLIPMFKADRFDADALIDLYAKAGAQYFVSMAVHHDNFDMWNSKHQPRWNAMATGPKRDIVGEWKAAARKRGLRFGVSEHLPNSFYWYGVAHESDSTGPLAGVPYDGTNPEYADLYHEFSGMKPGFYKTAKAEGINKSLPERWKRHYYSRIKDLIDQHEPDLLYTDGSIPFEQYGLGLVAELYNASARNHSGRVEAVYNSKLASDCETGTCTIDEERGIFDEITSFAWQSDTCIGDWHYKRGITYKTPKRVIDLLVDIVSKNGTMLLNIPLPNSGEPDADEKKVIAGITEWMQINKEGIIASRPWKMHGEGPGTKPVKADNVRFNEEKKPDLTEEDIRYTTKDGALYAFAMGWPKADFKMNLLGTASAQKPGKVRHVAMLGTSEKLDWKQDADALRIKLPKRKPSETTIAIGSGFKIVVG